MQQAVSLMLTGIWMLVLINESAPRGDGGAHSRRFITDVDHLCSALIVEVCEILHGAYLLICRF